MARGVKFGRPPVLTPHQRQEATQRLAEGATQADLARTYGVSQATISRLEPAPFDGASASAAALWPANTSLEMIPAGRS
jgi:predicted transcriptional regulator